MDHENRRTLSIVLALALACAAMARAQAPAAPAVQGEGKASPAEAAAVPAEPKPEPPKAKAPASKAAKAEGKAPAGEPRDRKVSRGEIVQVGRPVTIQAGESAEKVVVIGAPCAVHGYVEDEVVVIGGPLEVSGTIDGNAVSIGGSVRLAPTAVVDGEAVALGGSIDAAPGSRVERGTKSVSLPVAMPDLGWAKDWLVSGLLLGRPLPHGADWAWALAGALLLVYVLVAAAFPGPVERCSAALEARPATALGAGLLGCAMAAPVALLLTISVIGIAAVPLAACALLAGALLGKAGVYRLAGSRLGAPLGLAQGGFGPVSVALGGAVFTVAYAVPFVGLVAWMAAGVVGFGAALLVLVDAFQGERRPAVEGGASAPAAAPVALEQAPVPSAAASSLPRAGFWERLGAVAIDGILFLVLAAILPVVTANLFAWAAFQIGLWTWKGTTIGGIVFGLRGVRLDGGRMDLGVAVVRHLASYLSALAGFLGFLWAAWDPERQTWHDKIAGTLVVKVPKTEPLI